MARAKRKQSNLVDINSARTTQRKRVHIVPRNVKQEEYFDYLHDYNNRIVVAAGAAGTGKTMIAVTQAIKALQNQDITKIILTRPAVGVEGENHGFLPGTLHQKMEPWLMPIYDVFEEYYSKHEMAAMLEDGTIEVAPLMYMRGRSLKNSFIIFDEAQNSTPEQMKMILTRIGEGSRIVVTGDLDQTDHRKKNGLEDWCGRVSDDHPNIKICRFGVEHVERDPIVQDVLNLYKDE